MTSSADQPAELARPRRDLIAPVWRGILKNRRLRGGADVRLRSFDQHAGTWPVRLMCRVLGVSASGYYALCSRQESQMAIANRRLLQKMQRLHAQHQGRYGSLCITWR